MSLYYWDPFRSSRVYNRGFGLDPDDLLALTVPFQRNLYLNPWQAPIRDVSPIVSDKDKFQVSVDVQHFKPDEISVKTSGNTVVIEGKHEEKPDEHGFIFRHFVRKYDVPNDHDLNQVQSTLSSDGVLTITAPKKAIGGQGVTSIPITQTGQPSKPMESKREEVSQPAVYKNVENVPEQKKQEVVPSQPPPVQGERIIPIAQEPNTPVEISPSEPQQQPQ
ncbi:alpha-crystallin A chain-like [Agrilus planipennis]|uniref:Alpha-crystallin A chain-like n=1 Tax=Agrilus planipennis TaxID=224129 RepID=A0A1W4WW47_AGRPL|nr:alpha-crystallin A chain-like [Agrilus planipennis]